MHKMKGVRLDYKKGCFSTAGGRCLKGVHSLIKKWYASDYNPSEARRLASELPVVDDFTNDSMCVTPKPGFSNGSRIDLEMHRWAESGESPKHPVAKKALETLKAAGFDRFKGKHGVKTRTDYVYTEIDFLVQRDGKVYAVELKSGYDKEFYQSTGKMNGALSSVDNSLCNQAIVQVTMGWYLHHQNEETRCKFKIHDAFVLHAPCDLNRCCRIIPVPTWAKKTLMDDLHHQFAVKPRLKKQERIEKKRKTTEKKAHRRIEKELKLKGKELRLKQKEQKLKEKEEKLKAKEQKLKEKEKKKKQKVKTAKKK